MTTSAGGSNDWVRMGLQVGSGRAFPPEEVLSLRFDLIEDYCNTRLMWAPESIRKSSCRGYLLQALLELIQRGDQFLVLLKSFDKPTGEAEAVWVVQNSLSRLDCGRNLEMVMGPDWRKLMAPGLAFLLGLFNRDVNDQGLQKPVAGMAAVIVDRSLVEPLASNKDGVAIGFIGLAGIVLLLSTLAGVWHRQASVLEVPALEHNPNFNLDSASHPRFIDPVSKAP